MNFTQIVLINLAFIALIAALAVQFDVIKAGDFLGGYAVKLLNSFTLTWGWSGGPWAFFHCTRFDIDLEIEFWPWDFDVEFTLNDPS